MVVSFITLQLFSALEKFANSHFTVSYNISLYRDTKVAIYRYTQIVYHYTSNMVLQIQNGICYSTVF